MQEDEKTKLPPVGEVDELAQKDREKLAKEQAGETEVKDKSPEEQAEEIAKADSDRYLERRYKEVKNLLDEKKVEDLLNVVQNWPENWMEQTGQKRDEMKKQAIEALKLEDKDENTQNMILEAVGKVLKENKNASKLDPPPAGTFLKGIQDQLDVSKNRDLGNWKSWYENTNEGRSRWQEILADVKKQNEAGKQIEA